MASIFKRGKVYWARYKREGKWLSESLKTTDEAEAREKLQFYACLDTFSDYSLFWLAGREKDVAPDTFKQETYVIKNYLNPHWKQTLLSKVKPLDIISFLASYRSKLAKGTVKVLYRVLRSIFKDAVIAGILTVSPCTIKPKDIQGKREKSLDTAKAVFNQYEVKELLTNLMIPLRYRLMWAILAYGGLRVSEMIALTWDDIEVHPNLNKLIISKSGSSITKTGAIREVPIHSTTQYLLDEHEKNSSHNKTDLIFPSKKGSLLNRNFILKMFHLSLKKLGFRRRRVHDLRRTFVTLARSNGANPGFLIWITHCPKNKGMVNYYTSPSWEDLCKQVQCLPRYESLLNPYKQSRLDSVLEEVEDYN